MQAIETLLGRPLPGQTTRHKFLLVCIHLLPTRRIVATTAPPVNRAEVPTRRFLRAFSAQVGTAEDMGT